MKIVFVENKLRIDKLGPLYLSAILKENGHDVELVQDIDNDIDDYFKNNSPDIALYSVMSSEHNWYLGINKELKSKYKFKAIFGGPHFTFFSEENINDPYIDHIVVGPGELVINDVVNGKYSEKIIRGQTPPDINSIPQPDRSILYKYDQFGNSNMKRFIASRDCPNACTYCFNHLYRKMFKDQKQYFFQKTNPDRLIKEISEVIDTYGMGMVYFNDDDFASDHDWLYEFLKEYEKKINLPFCGSLRANNVNEDVARRLGEANCHFMNMAIESSNPQTQKMLRRGKIKNEDIINANGFLKENGILVRLQNMIGLPVDDPLADAIETFEFNRKLNPTDSWASIFQPFKKTKIWEQCVEKGLIDKDQDCLRFYDGTQLKIENASQINNLHKWWYFAVKYQFETPFLKLLINQELDDDTKKRIQDYRWEKTAKEIYKI